MRSEYKEYEPCNMQEMLAMYRYSGQLASAIRGKRGQLFLKELKNSLEEMPERKLIAYSFITKDGCCALGAIMKKRGIEPPPLLLDSASETISHKCGQLLNIAKQLAAEIIYLNDTDCAHYECTEEQRWLYVYSWVCSKIK